MIREKARRLHQALLRSWGADTAYKGDWTPALPSRNQCAVTALAAQDHLGGTLVGGLYRTPKGENGSHYWNELDGLEIDFTRDQFPAGTLIECASRDAARETLLKNPDTAARYAVLAGRLQQTLGSLSSAA